MKESEDNSVFSLILHGMKKFGDELEKVVQKKDINIYKGELQNLLYGLIFHIP